MSNHQFDEKIDEALEFVRAGNASAALSTLSSFVKDIPDDDERTLRIVGALFLEGKDFNQALRCYEKAVSFNPKSAEASIGLFHSLVNAGRDEDAFAELKRFLSISESEEHFRLIEEMRDALLDRKG